MFEVMVRCGTAGFSSAMFGWVRLGSVWHGSDLLFDTCRGLCYTSDMEMCQSG